MDAPAIVHEVLRAPGQPLDAATRAFMEPRFGRDFSHVRVHTDGTAASSARAVAAHAYTVGSNVVFGAGRYTPASHEGRRLLAHELAHVAQQDPTQPALRRAPDCARLLSANESGPSVPESAVQAYLASELEAEGDVVREFQVPGGSAAPWRTEGQYDSVIEPQVIAEWISGRVDIALLPGEPALDFLEVKRATPDGLVFAENQLANYVIKGNEWIRDVERRWRRRTGDATAMVAGVRGMSPDRYTPPDTPVTIAGQQVLLAWCGPGVILFKALDLNNKKLYYCGVSDDGRTKEFIDGMLLDAQELVARAIRRRLRVKFPSDPVNLGPLLDAVRTRLSDTIARLLQETLDTVCMTAVELSMAAVLDGLRKLLANEDFVDHLIEVLNGARDPMDLHIGEVAGKTAAVLTVGGMLWELLSLVPAFI